MSELGRLREVAEAATPGPWYWEPPSGEDWPQSDESLLTRHRGEGDDYDPDVLSAWGYDASGTHASDEDRTHISTFDPPTVLALLDRLEAAEAKVARAQALAEEWAADPVGGDLWRSDAVDDLRAALGAPQPADAPEGHGDADEAGA